MQTAPARQTLPAILNDTIKLTRKNKTLEQTIKHRSSNAWTFFLIAFICRVRLICIGFLLIVTTNTFASDSLVNKNEIIIYTYFNKASNNFITPNFNYAFVRKFNKYIGVKLGSQFQNRIYYGNKIYNGTINYNKYYPTTLYYTGRIKVNYICLNIGFLLYKDLGKLSISFMPTFNSNVNTGFWFMDETNMIDERKLENSYKNYFYFNYNADLLISYNTKKITYFIIANETINQIKEKNSILINKAYKKNNFGIGFGIGIKL